MLSKYNSPNIDAFFALLRAGLWEQNVNLSHLGKIDFSKVFQLAESQSVIGIVLAGLEHVGDVKVASEDKLPFLGSVLQLESHNKAMNQIIEKLILGLRKSDIYTLLVKGQGVAQCYERPLWRSAGDIDFYLSKDNFEKAKRYFRPLVTKFDPDNEYTRHINMHYGEWVVEIHANQNCSLSGRINHVLSQIHRDLFYSGNVRSWLNGNTQVFLPAADNDVVLSFTHFLNHFYEGGLGVRQICDWSRLLWTFRETLDIRLLESRVREMGLMSEWKVFGAFAVDFLGMPSGAMPFFDESRKWKRKAAQIRDFLLEVGNFGHNRDSSYYGKYPFVIRKAFSFGRRCGDALHHARIFPVDSFRFLIGITVSGLKSVAHGA